MFDDNLIERFELASERIKEIKTAGGACSDGRFSDYFCKMSEFIISMTELLAKLKIMNLKIIHLISFQSLINHYMKIYLKKIMTKAMQILFMP